MFWAWLTNLRPDDSTLFFATGVSSTLFAWFQEFTNLLWKRHVEDKTLDFQNWIESWDSLL